MHLFVWGEWHLTHIRILLEMVVLILRCSIIHSVGGSYALSFLHVLICAHGVRSLLLFLHWQVRSLEILNIDNIFDTFAAMGANILGLRIQ